MVCHPLPPPLPSMSILSNALTKVFVTYYCGSNYFPGRLLLAGWDNLKAMPGFGLTLALNEGFIYEYTLFAPILRSITVNIIRTVEEGWVLIPHGYLEYGATETQRERKWKRLGWLDWLDDGQSQRQKEATASQLADDLVKIITDFDIVSAETGWRYESPLGISSSELHRLAEGLPSHQRWDIKYHNRT